MSKRINMTSRKPNPYATFGGVSNDDDKVADILAKSATRADAKDVDQWLAREAKINRDDYEQRAQQARFNQEGQEFVAKAKHAFTELGMLLDQLEQQNEKALYKKYLKLQIALSQGWKSDINSLPRLLNKWENAKDDPVILQFLSNKVDRDYRKKYVTILPEEYPKDYKAYISEADLDETDLDDIEDLDQEFDQKLKLESRDPGNVGRRGFWWADQNQITVDKINTMFAQIAQMKELAAINNVNLETEHKDILQFENAVIEAIETNNINDLKILSEQYSSDQVQTQLKESVGLISNDVEEGIEKSVEESNVEESNVEEGGQDDDDDDDEGAAQRKARI